MKLLLVHHVLCLMLLTAELMETAPLILNECNDLFRTIILNVSSGASAGTVLVIASPGLRLQSDSSGSEYLALRNGSIVLSQAALWPATAERKQMFLCGPSLMSAVIFRLTLVDDAGPQALLWVEEPPASLRVWRFSPAGTQLHSFRARARGACPMETEFWLLDGAPYLSLQRSSGLLRLAQPLPPEAPDRLRMRIEARDPVTSGTVVAVVELAIYSLWRRPVVELEIQSEIPGRACAAPIINATDFLLEPDASITVLWRHQSDGAPVALLLEAELAGARERMLVRAACKQTSETTRSFANAATPAKWNDGRGGGSCAPVAAGCATAAFAVAALLTFVITVTICRQRLHRQSSSCSAEASTAAAEDGKPLRSGLNMR